MPDHSVDRSSHQEQQVAGKPERAAEFQEAPGEAEAEASRAALASAGGAGTSRPNWRGVGRATREQTLHRMQQELGNQRVQRLLGLKRVQRTCACGRPAHADGECGACRAERLAGEAQPSESVQRLAVQRQPAPAQLAEQERNAFDEAKKLVGKPVVRVYFNSANKSPRDTEEFMLEQLIERPNAEPKRLGFDSAGPALAFASMSAAGQGAVVIKQDVFCFAGRLKVGKHELRGRDAELSEVPTWQLVLFGWGAKLAQMAVRSPVFKVEPIGPSVTGAAARDGLTFPINTEIEPDFAKAEKQGGKFIPIKPGSDIGQGGPAQTPTPADANSMRALAGIQPEGQKEGEPPKTADAVALSPEQQDLFIANYFRARGREALDENEKQVENLTTTFAPTTGATAGAPGHGISPEAQKLIDEGRRLGVFYREVIDNESRLEAEIRQFDRTKPKQSTVSRRRTTVPLGPEPILTVGKETKTVKEWEKALLEKKQAVTDNKLLLLSLSPVLAQIAPYHGREYRTVDVSGIERKPFSWEEDPYKNSLMGKPASPENDEQIRATFEKKLDGIRKALREARAKMISEDLDFLMGMEGLRNRVKADFDRIQGPNQKNLKSRLDEQLKTRDLNKKAAEGVTEVILLAALFVPGGQLLAAVGGFILSAEKMNEAFKRQTFSQAAVDPSKALVSPDQAEKELAAATVDLAINSVFLALEVNGAIAALEGGGRVPAGFAKAAAEPGLPPGVRAMADAGEGHTIKVTDIGVLMCSPPPCAPLRMHYAEVLERDAEDVLEKQLKEIDDLALTDAKGAASKAVGMRNKLAGMAKQQRTKIVAEALQKDPQLASLLTIPAVGGDVSKLTGAELIKGGAGAIKPEEIVTRLRSAMGTLEKNAGELTPRVLGVEGIEEYFKAACTSANPHTVEFELFGLVEQMRAHPNSQFRFQLQVGGKAAADVVRYEGERAVLVQFKSFTNPSDVVKDMKEQLAGDLRRLQKEGFMIPGPGGRGKVPVDNTLIYEIDWTRFKTANPGKNVESLEYELQHSTNDYLEALAKQDPAFTSHGQPFKVKYILK